MVCPSHHLILNLARIISEADALLPSVENVLKYAENLPCEADHLPSDTNATDWLKHGCVQFNDVVCKYNETILALNHVDFEVKPGEAVGVVGSGKYILLSALLRLINIEQPGSITIDGVDISSLGMLDYPAY